MKLYYVHDPMCSWCWAFRPIYIQLKNKLPNTIELIRLLGGLAADSDQPMAEDTRVYIMGQWQKIQQEIPSIEFNYDFWRYCQPRRSTYPACRAVIAARQQGNHFDEQMTFAIQQAYYLKAKNPSDIETLIELANEIGCDAKQFDNDLRSKAIDDQLKQELTLARELKLNSFPSFLLTNQQEKVPIRPDYHDADSLLAKIISVAL